MDNTRQQPPVGLTIMEQMEFKRLEDQRQMRIQQFNEDLLEMLTALDPDLFRKFTLRWALSHPPGGWDDPKPIILAMHAQRLVNVNIDNAGKLISARAMTAAGMKLPPGVTLEGDVLTGQVGSMLEAGRLKK